MATCNLVDVILFTIISMSNCTSIVCIVCDLEEYMSPHYNVLAEGLENHVVYKHVTMTSLFWLHTHNNLYYLLVSNEKNDK